MPTNSLTERTPKFSVSVVQDGGFPPAGFLEESTVRMATQAFIAMLGKLLKKQEQHGTAWAGKDWLNECRTMLREHVEKGDPLDVMALSAMLHWHGESTNGATLHRDWTIQAPDGSLDWSGGATAGEAMVNYLVREGGSITLGWEGGETEGGKRFTIVDPGGNYEHVRAGSELAAIKDYFESTHHEIKPGHLTLDDLDEVLHVVAEDIGSWCALVNYVNPNEGDEAGLSVIVEVPANVDPRHRLADEFAHDPYWGGAVEHGTDLTIKDLYQVGDVTRYLDSVVKVVVEDENISITSDKTLHELQVQSDEEREEALARQAAGEPVKVWDEPHGEGPDRQKLIDLGKKLVEKGVGGGETLPGRWNPPGIDRDYVEIPNIVQRFMEVRKTPAFIEAHRCMAYASTLGYELLEDGMWKDKDGGLYTVAELPLPPADFLEHHIPRVVMAEAPLSQLPAGKVQVMQMGHTLHVKPEERVLAQLEEEMKTEKEWTVILNYETPESENEAGYATSAMAPTWEAAVDLAIKEFIEHDEWGNGDDKDPRDWKIQYGAKIRLMDVFPGPMNSLASNELYVVTKKGNLPEDVFRAMGEEEQKSITELVPEDIPE